MKMMDCVEVIVEKVGDRPCADGVDERALSQFKYEWKEIIEKIIDKEERVSSGSTDCNIPASLGVPALCVGSYYGGGAHTREEWINIESLNQGLDVAIELIKKYI